jgi:hypothetical protein
MLGRSPFSVVHQPPETTAVGGQRCTITGIGCAPTEDGGNDLPDVRRQTRPRRDDLRLGLEGSGPTPARRRSDEMQTLDADPRKVIRNWRALAAKVGPRAATILLLVRTAVATDPEMAQGCGRAVKCRRQSPCRGRVGSADGRISLVWQRDASATPQPGARWRCRARESSRRERAGCRTCRGTQRAPGV